MFGFYVALIVVGLILASKAATLGGKVMFVAAAVWSAYQLKRGVQCSPRGDKRNKCRCDE